MIADDSAFMRKVLSDLFARQPDFEVIGTAMNGKETVDKVKKLRPDLLTLDINMPVMDGLSALAVIMRDCPLPVIMLSSVTKQGAKETIRALELGAIDFVCKAGGEISRIEPIEADLLSRCRAAVRAKSLNGRIKGEVLKPSPSKLSAAKPSSETAGRKLVAIGTSTGGPQSLQQVIPLLPADLPCGVVLVQHMPQGFTKPLAERLNSLSAVSVKEAEDGETVKAGWVYIAPGGKHLRVATESFPYRLKLGEDPPVGNHRPAVNVLYDSVASLGGNLVAVIMTGMGADGCEGMRKIKAQGGYSIAQNEETSVVYGMPKAVVEAGLADEVRPLGNIAEAIVEAVKK